MKPYYERDGIVIYHGDCRDILPTLDPVDSVITDPPYELGFMGKHWDRSGVSFDPETWRLILEAAKPGVMLLSFGGTRTWHRIAVAIEDAGWEIRDTICWLYGSGFPKSLDISKAIDKAAGAERNVVGRRIYPDGTPAHGGATNAYAQDKWTADPANWETMDTAPATDAARKWDGWGTALKPAFEPIIVAMKPLDGTFAENALAHGVAGVNIDGCRIGTYKDIPASGAKIQRGNSWTKANPEAVGGGFDRNLGRWPANVILECTCEETRKGRVTTGNTPADYTPTGKRSIGHHVNVRTGAHYGDAVRIHTDPDCPCAMLDRQSGERTSGAMRKPYEYTNTGHSMGAPAGATRQIHEANSGGASRFFYAAKASRSERERYVEGIDSVTGAEAVDRQPDAAGLDSPRAGAGRTASRLRNDHPTVKPLALMRYLCRLTKTPTGGIVLDPFMGSGTTLIAARLEGRPCVGIEKDERACEIAVKRLAQEVLAL